MNITVVGAGNVGTQIAVHCAEKKHEVVIYGSKPERISSDLEIVDEYNNIIHKASIKKATNIPREAFGQCDLVFITMPAFCMEELAQLIFPFCYSGLKICLVPGTGGWEYAFKKCIDKGAILIGMERVPSVARLVRYGKSVCARGYRNKLKVATLPKRYLYDCCKLISEIFDMECEAVREFLSITMTPSNPILHTTRLYTLFKDYEEGITYDRIPLFYEEWNNESSELLIKCDEEVQDICRKIESRIKMDLSDVRSLKEHYGSYTADAMTGKISGISAFKGLKTPAIKSGNYYLPDFDSRYFTADFPYGLSILVQLSHMMGIKAENMEEVMGWYDRVCKSKKQFMFENYDIYNVEDIEKVYNI